MTEINLNDSDYRDIYQFALKNFIDKAAPYKKTETSKENFLVYCIVEAFLLYLNSRELIVKDGKVYKLSDQEGHNS